MVKNLEDMQKFGKDGVEAVFRSFDACAKNAQSIGQEMVDYSRKSVEDGTKTVEKLFGAKSLDNAVEIQNAYFKATYEGFVLQSSKLGSMCIDLARESYKPFESQFAKTTSAK